MDRTRIAVLAALVTAFAAAPALAQPEKPAAETKIPQADLDKAKEHFAKGKELFDKKDFAAAVEEFKESYRLSKNPLLLYNVGFTLDQLGQRALALFYYQKFVAAVPGENPNVGPAKERIEVLQKDIEDASLSGAAAPAAPTAPTAGDGGKATTAAPTAPSDGSAPVTKFDHALIDSAPPGKPIDVGLFVPPGNFQVSLYFRAAGEAKFASVEMKPRYNERVGRIPAERTGAPTVQYYIEVRDDNGKLVHRSGKATSPNLIFVENDAKPHYYADLGDDESYHEKTEVASSTYSGGGRDVDGPRGDGWLDAGSSKFGYLKWGSTATAAGFLALAGTFYLMASSASSGLEGDATSSIGGGCPSGPPCLKFSGDQQDAEGKGQRFETLTNVTLGIGAVAAVGAGVFWFLEIKDKRNRRSSRSAAHAAIPLVGSDLVGAAAAFEF